MISPKLQRQGLTPFLLGFQLEIKLVISLVFLVQQDLVWCIAITDADDKASSL
jgi:hypothetical protein